MDGWSDTYHCRALINSANGQRSGRQHWTECSDLGAQSMHAAGQSKWTDGQQLLVDPHQVAANAKAGLLCRWHIEWHQPRAREAPIAAPLGP